MTRSAVKAALALLVALAAAAPSGAAAADGVRPLGAKGPLKSQKLSDERTITRLARPVELGRVYSQPSVRSHKKGRLHLETEDGIHEIYLVLQAKVVKKQTWLQIRLPKRPNGQKGWVKRDMLGPLITLRTFLKIDRSSLRATLFRGGKKIWSSRVGVGKAATPTPGGRFWVRERLRSLGGAYGPYAFGTSAYSKLSDWPGGGVVGIHGTNEPNLIPGRPSHGCVRMPNYKVLKLKKLMPIGTPVQIV
jgi:lipoprotein-anchoring transpeptidase ErfK/SrfK